MMSSLNPFCSVLILHMVLIKIYSGLPLFFCVSLISHMSDIIRYFSLSDLFYLAVCPLGSPRIQTPKYKEQTGGCQRKGQGEWVK